MIRAPAASVTEVEGGPGTGKTAVALHRAAYLLYQDRRRYAGGILIVSPTPLLVAYTEGVLPSLGEEGQVAIRAVGSPGRRRARPPRTTTRRWPGSRAPRGCSRCCARRPGAPWRRRSRRTAAAARLRRRARAERRGRHPDPAARRRLRPPARAGGRRAGPHPAQRAQRHRPRQPAAPARPQAAAGRPVGKPPAPAAGTPTRELAAELRSSFDEDVTTEDAFIGFLDAWWPELTPRGVLAAMADERRLGRWARRILNPGEVRRLARSLSGWTRTATVRSPCTTWRCSTSSRRCSAPRPGPSRSASSTRWTSSPGWRS